MKPHSGNASSFRAQSASVNIIAFNSVAMVRNAAQGLSWLFGKLIGTPS